MRADVDIEYIGHASFVIESPGGVRIVIDPFNSNRWLGFRYPESVDADAVVVTHPHYDHDASYYWGDSVPIFREPGDYRVGDVRLVGVEGKHAGPYGKDFEQKNTIWLIFTTTTRREYRGSNPSSLRVTRIETKFLGGLVRAAPKRSWRLPSVHRQVHRNLDNGFVRVVRLDADER